MRERRHRSYSLSHGPLIVVWWRGGTTVLMLIDFVLCSCCNVCKLTCLCFLDLSWLCRVGLTLFTMCSLSTSLIWHCSRSISRTPLTSSIVLSFLSDVSWSEVSLLIDPCCWSFCRCSTRVALRGTEVIVSNNNAEYRITFYTALTGFTSNL